MKIKVLSRSTAEHTRECAGDVYHVNKNADPTLHPFEREREYVRALNATKLDKVFAKPLLGALSGHFDGVCAMCKHPTALSTLVSGDLSGEVRAWHVATQRCLGVLQAHEGAVRGTVFLTPKRFLTASTDGLVKLWQYPLAATAPTGAEAGAADGTGTPGHSSEFSLRLGTAPSSAATTMQPPVATFQSEVGFTSIDAQPAMWNGHGRDNGRVFATGSAHGVAVWDVERAEPLLRYTWGSDTVQAVRFSGVEAHLLAACAGDRSVALYDVRESSSGGRSGGIGSGSLSSPLAPRRDFGGALHKVVLTSRCNAVAWNPMVAYQFVVANDDHNLYTFDVRHLGRALQVHHAHVGAVMDVDYSPTGREFASGSFDCTVRIWESGAAFSRDVYHTQRMQRLLCVRFSDDARYVLTGSDEGSIRVWKARASEPMKLLTAREQRALDYKEKLKQRFAAAPEIRRIARFHRVPKAVLVKRRTLEVMRQAQLRRQQHVLAHSRPGTVRVKSRRSKPIVTEVE